MYFFFFQQQVFTTFSEKYGLEVILFSFFQILLVFIWLRSYPTMHEVSMIFNISVDSVHRIIHKLLPYLHSYLVSKYIRWHSMAHWRRLAGHFKEWPNVVAILDGTPFRISRPRGTYLFTITLHPLCACISFFFH